MVAGNATDYSQLQTTDKRVACQKLRTEFERRLFRDGVTTRPERCFRMRRESMGHNVKNESTPSFTRDRGDAMERYTGRNTAVANAALDRGESL